MNEQNNIAQPAIVVTLTRTLGAYGAAFDLPGPHRAFTYHHQPGNIGAHRLGAAWQKAASGSSGDLIDRGLGLLKALQEVGFGVFEVSEIAAPVAGERAALARLEAACDTLCRLRTQEQYLSMVDSGQQDALLELDGARAQARSALASAPVVSLPSQTRWPVLRAMSKNYTSGKHVWDALDADACEKGAEEIQQLRAAISKLASAPVAGEAVGVVQPNGNTFRLSRPLPAGTKVYAVPQASADAGNTASGPVRNAALEEAAKLMDQTLRSNGAALIRGLKRSQADKDGGQQRAGDAALARLAEPHTGMRVDYQGLLRQAREGLRDSPGLAEMLRQLQGHLRELGQRWYAGDTAVVDELLQLYCVESNARAALSATQAEQGERDA